jgi:predicted nucleotidyltransferase
MAQKILSNKIKQDIYRLIEELQCVGIRIERAIVFGSHVTGRADEFSDIDVALVSKDFVGSRFDNNMQIAKIVLKVNYLLETHPYRPEDFYESPFVKDEIINKGIEISINA